jgi:hypothetical protein
VRNLVRRLQKLEGRLTDATGLVPHSEAWFAYYEDQFGRLVDGENVPCIPLAVIDRIIEDADRAEQAEKDALAARASIPGQAGYAGAR